MGEGDGVPVGVAVGVEVNVRVGVAVAVSVGSIVAVSARAIFMVDGGVGSVDKVHALKSKKKMTNFDMRERILLRSDPRT